MPSVEELNGEGFPYSPYVLRRQELLTPAALNAAPTRTAAMPPTGVVPAPVTATELPRVAAGGPLVDPAAAARVAAAAVQAQEEAERGPAVPPPAAASPVQAAPPRPSGGYDGAPQAGGHAAALPTARAGDTQALVPEPPAPAADRGLVEPRPSAEDTGGLGGLFGGAGTREHAPQPQRELPPELQPRRITGPPPPPRGSSAAAPGDPPTRRGRVLALVAAGLVLVVALAVIGVLLLTGDDDGGSTDAGPSTSAPAPSSTTEESAVGTTEVVNGVTFTLQATQTDATCQDHAYDAVADFFATSDCTALVRSLWSAETGGQPAVVSFSQVTMPDVASAQALRSLADTDGSGNVSDLLREGVRYDGGPTSLTRAQYASTQQSTTVTIVETAWTGAGAGATSALDGLASTALALPADEQTSAD